MGNKDRAIFNGLGTLGGILLDILFVGTVIYMAASMDIWMIAVSTLAIFRIIGHDACDLDSTMYNLDRAFKEDKNKD